MAYTAPTSRSTGYTVTATDYNLFVTNQLHFANRPVSVLTYTPGVAITSTSTSFIDADATNLNLSITTSTNILAILVSLRTAGGGGIVNFDVILDSTTRAGNATYGLIQMPGNAEMGTFFGLWTGVSKAAHTLKVQYKTDGTTNGIAASYPVRMQAFEV